MRLIYEISNESSPGTKENWYEAYIEGKDGEEHVATFHTRDELNVYLMGLLELIGITQAKGETKEELIARCDASEYAYKIYPHESNE